MDQKQLLEEIAQADAKLKKAKSEIEHKLARIETMDVAWSLVPMFSTRVSP